MKQFKHTACALLLGLLGLSAPAQAQAWQWAKSASTLLTGANTVASTTATAITPSGEVYTAYRHNGALTLGNQTYPANGQQYNAVLVHHDASGNVVGSALLVATNAIINDVKTDGQGNLYAMGRFGGQVTAGTSSLTTTNVADFFVAKWDAAGTLQWLRQGVASQPLFTSNASEMAIDASGNVTIGSEIRGPVNFSGQTAPAPANQPALMLAQYNAAGNVNWVRASLVPASSAVNFASLAAAPDGTLHVVGTSASNFSWGNSTVVLTGNRNGYWLKLNAAGDLLDSERYGVPGQGMSAPHITTDLAGTPYVAINAYGSSLNWGTNTFPMPTGGSMGFFLTSLNPNGVPRWVKTGALPDSSYATVSSLRAVSDLTDGNNVHVYLGGSFQILRPGAALTYSPFSLSNQGFQRSSDCFLLAVDGSSGLAEWLIPAVSSNSFDDLSALDANPAGQISVAGSYAGDTAHFSNIQLANVAPRWMSAYSAKLLQNYNLAQGTVFTDVNANGMQDVGEAPRGGVIVEAQPGNLYFTSENDGQYSAVLDLGTYTLSVPNPPLYYTAVGTGSAAVTFSTYGNLSTGHHFALQPTGPNQDLRVNLTPVGRARPGFTLTYRLTYRNVGTVPMSSGTVQFDYPSGLSYLSSSQPVTQAGNTLSLTYGTLQPGETQQLDVLFQVPTSAVLGSTLSSTARIEPVAGDLIPADNVEISQMTVVGSYDPNDISVNYNQMTPTQVQNGEWLEYTVRFQNLGTDTAFSVLLRDALPTQQLRLGTLQVVAASHSCAWSLNPDGVMSVSFPNIRLPHRNANSIRSQGFVRFRVKPLGSLAIGEIIPNQANIHFDFNQPVTTNTATTEVNMAAGLPHGADLLAGSVWPNPASGLLNVEAQVSGPVAFTLLDATGRPVLTHSGTASRTQLDVRGLPAGLYLLRAQSGRQSFTKRVVLR